MQEVQAMFIRQRKYMYFLLSIFVLGWGFTPYKTVFAGLILGTSLSFFNLWQMNRKMKAFDEAIETGTKMRSLGTMSRLATAALATILALEYPEYFHLISVVVGLMTIYIVILIDFFIHLIRR